MALTFSALPYRVFSKHSAANVKKVNKVDVMIGIKNEEMSVSVLKKM